ncbi:hypothetical protein Tco_0568440 [Tanacetum coccineum]
MISNLLTGFDKIIMDLIYSKKMVEWCRTKGEKIWVRNGASKSGNYEASFVNEWLQRLGIGDHPAVVHDDDNVEAAAAATLEVVVCQVEAKYKALLFKQQITVYVEKIYGIIRGDFNEELGSLLTVCIQGDIFAAEQKLYKEAGDSNMRPCLGGCWRECWNNWPELTGKQCSQTDVATRVNGISTDLVAKVHGWAIIATPFAQASNEDDSLIFSPFKTQSEPTPLVHQVTLPRGLKKLKLQLDASMGYIDAPVE